MAEEFTLRAYIERIETMIRQGRMDEAIAHSAHILQFYPKNAVVYRNMGRALMRLQRYEEASEIFRRLLAAVPDDFSSHYQLSIVYENENNADAAIWHVERAFDQQPNNEQVNDRLRELYKKFKQIDVDKIQLTAGAVAIQYSKAGMYSEAISLLQRTLVKVPDRADLLTTLAKTQWERGDAVDAAETSLDLLKSYPYALEANRILSELWLQEERPSDAQRYLSRVEDIDPYLAYEIATDDDVPDEQFMVEELDFSKYAASLASQEQTPDWLANIEKLTESEQNALQSEAVADSVLDDGDDDNSWLNELHEESQPIIPAKKKVTDDLSDLLPDDFNFPDSAGTDDTVDEDELSKLALLDDAGQDDDFDDLFDDLDDFDMDNTGLTGLLDEDEEYAGTGLTGLLGDDDLPAQKGKTTGLTGMLGLLGLEDEDADNPQTDDLDWLNEVSAGNYNTDNLNQINDVLTGMDADEDFFAEMDATDNDADKDDSLAWLSTDNLISDTVDESDDMNTDNLDSPTNIDPNDPMAWLQDTDIDFDEDADDSAGFFIEDDPVTIESSSTSPMAWLGEENLDDEFVPDTGEFNTDDNQDDSMAWLQDDNGEFGSDSEESATDDLGLDDSMAWLQDEGIEFEDESENFETVDTNDLLTGQLATLDDNPQDIDGDPMAWLEDGGVEFLDTVDDDNNDEWLADDSVLDDLLNIADLNNSEPTDAIETDDLFIDTEMQDTMNDQPDWTADDDFNSDDGLDWLDNEEETGLDNFEPQQEDDSMAWLAEDDGIVLENEEDDSMAWLAEDDGIALENEEDDSMAWLAEDDGIALESEQDDSIAWLADDSNGSIIEAEEKVLDEDLPQAKAATSLLNFLSDEHSELEIDDSLHDMSEEDAFADDGMDWLLALDGDDTQDDSGEEIAEPVSEDWLAELGDNDMTDEPEADAEEWELGDGFTDELSDDDNLESAEVDWLADISDQDDSDDFSDENGEFEAQDTDWLSEPDPEQDDWAVGSGFTDELSDEDDSIEPAEADWLADISDQDDSDDSSDENSEFEAQDTDWLSESDPEEDDWAVGSGFTDELSDEEDSLEPVEADWLADLSDDDDSDDFSDEEDSLEPAEADWLAEISDDDDSDDFSDEEDSLEPAEADWLADLSDDDDSDDFADDEDSLEPVEADWLADLSDDDDSDDFSDEEDSLEPVEADWLAEISDDDDSDDFSDEEDSLEPAEADWLADLSDDDDSDDFSDEDSLEPVEADWLAEISDQDDIQTDDLELGEEPIAEAEENWLSDIGVEEEASWTDEDYANDFEVEEDYELNASTTGMSDMLDTIRTSRDEDNYETTLDDIDANEPEWLKQTGEHLVPEQNEEVDWGDDETDFNEEAVPLAEFEEDEAELFEASASSNHQDDYEEDLEQADADNAPDWLNAMVPGLDLDFEAEDEGYLDEGFEERENTLRERRINESETIKSDFNWLQDIVEEETGLMDAINDEDIVTRPPATIEPRKQYDFSAPPIWARDGSATDSIAQAVTMTNDTPDYLSDFDNFDDAPEYDLDDAFEDEFKFESEEIATVEENDDAEFAIGDETFDFDDIDNILDDEFDDEFDD